jgi:ferrous iron transport protein A
VKATGIHEEPKALSALPAGGHGIVQALYGGHEFCSRVANLGFTAGAHLKVLQNYGHGPILVSLRGTMVALGRAEAGKVFVLTTRGDEQLP